MPLMKSGSKKAFQHNVEVEMKAHPNPEDKDRNLAIAYSVKRKSKKPKKMAKGGMAYKNDSAATEQRPMPQERDNDALMISRNSNKKAPGQDSWTDNPTVEQAQRPSRTPLKHPKMVPQSLYTVRLRSEEDELEHTASPGPYGEQPAKRDDEESPNRQGPEVRDMEDEHSTKRKPYAKGGQIEPSDLKHEEPDGLSKHASEPTEEELQRDERRDELHLMLGANPSEDEGDMYAIDHDEDKQNRQGPDVMDMEDEHSTGRKPYHMGGYAEGGDVQYKDAMENEDDDMELNPAHGRFSADDSEDQPQSEEEMEHEDSIAAAIMSKKERQASLQSDSDMDKMVRMARGGEILEDSPDILSHDSIHSDDSDQADLRRNAEEDANEEDQLSFNALRKENYNESEGLNQLDHPRDSNLKGDEEESDSENQHDRVSRIMSKMNKNRQFKQR